MYCQLSGQKDWTLDQQRELQRTRDAKHNDSGPVQKTFRLAKFIRVFLFFFFFRGFASFKEMQQKRSGRKISDHKRSRKRNKSPKKNPQLRNWLSRKKETLSL